MPPPEIVDFWPLPGPTRPGRGLRKTPASICTDAQPGTPILKPFREVFEPLVSASGRRRLATIWLLKRSDSGRRDDSHFRLCNSQRDPEVVFWPSDFLEAWGTEANTPHIFRTCVVFGPCRRRGRGPQTILFLKMCVVLASAPQASKQPTT